MEELKIVEVTTKKQIKDFIELPLNMYKDNPYYVPPIYMDEKALFKKDCIHNLTCDQIFFVAYRDNKPVGRIQGIIQKQFNDINKTKKARFSRFHCEDNIETSKALLGAIEKWAKEKGMEEVIGPMGYNDLEREGLLIEGFDQLNTYEEEYNYPYYQKLIESNGYTKDVDWLEFKLYPEFYDREKLKKICDRSLRKMNLHIGGLDLNKKQFINKYADGIFECIDICYNPLYGTVPMTEETKRNTLDNLNLVLNNKFIIVVCDASEKVIAFGLLLPGIGKALQKSGGKMTLSTIIKLLKVINKPEVLDMALIGVLPEYQGLGVNAIMMSLLQDTVEKYNIKYLETNLNLETNNNVMGQWKYFKHEQHKRRRAFIKNISIKE